MAFANSVAQEVAGLATEDPYRIVLDYLRQHGQGRVNAKPYSEIEFELEKHGIYLSQTQFQQTVLKQTRGGDVFIGSTDHGPYKGYFLIVDEEDAEIAREFYCRRIHTQQTNLDHLEDLIAADVPQSSVH